MAPWILAHLFEQLSESLELGLELSVMVLQDLHTSLQTALVLSQQFGLRDHLCVTRLIIVVIVSGEGGWMGEIFMEIMGMLFM